MSGKKKKFIETKTEKKMTFTNKNKTNIPYR